MATKPRIPDHRAIRDRIETALAATTVPQRTFDVGNAHDRRVLAGLLRKTFASELAVIAEQAETIERVRSAVHKPRGTALPVWEVAAALYGEETAH